MTHSSLTIQIAPESRPATPFWMGEVAAFAHRLTHERILKAIEDQVRFAHARFGHYDVIDFVAVQIGVNACVNLRRNKFDPPLFSTCSYSQLTTSKVPAHVCAATQQMNAATPPCGKSSPPGHAVVDGWRRDERTRDILQSLPRSLVSSAKPTTGVQVVRPAAPQCLDSLTPDASRAGPLHPRPRQFASSPAQAWRAPR